MSKTLKPNTFNGKVNIFNDFTALLDYTQEVVKDESEEIQQKVVTYLSQKQPRMWCKNTIALTVALARNESQLLDLSKQATHYLNGEFLSESDLKSLKIINTNTATLTTQINTLTARLALMSSQLGLQPTKQAIGNAHSREVAEMVIAQTSAKPSTLKTNDLTEAKRKAKQILESIREE